MPAASCRRMKKNGGSCITIDLIYPMSYTTWLKLQWFVNNTHQILPEGHKSGHQFHVHILYIVTTHVPITGYCVILPYIRCAVWCGGYVDRVARGINDSDNKGA